MHFKRRAIIREKYILCQFRFIHANEIYTIKVELNETIQRPKIIKSALNAIKGITIGVAGNKITDLIDHGLEIIRNL